MTTTSLTKPIDYDTEIRILFRPPVRDEWREDTDKENYSPRMERENERRVEQEVVRITNEIKKEIIARLKTGQELIGFGPIIT